MRRWGVRLRRAPGEVNPATGCHLGAEVYFASWTEYLANLHECGVSSR